LDLPVAIERSEGLIVGLIASAGHPVLMAEPAGFNAARPRWGSTCTKTDAGDAFMLADYARTDGHRLRQVAPVAEATRELGVLVRARTCVVEARTAASNQLRAVLAEHWPGAAGLFQKLTSKITLAFLTDYPTPQAAAHLGEHRMGQFCRVTPTGAGSLPPSSSSGFVPPQRRPSRSARRSSPPSWPDRSPRSAS
jgi:transposase